MKILVFTLEVRTEEQGTLKQEGEKHLSNSTSEQFNSRKEEEETGTGLTASSAETAPRSMTE